jgi:hypothetical protein
MYKPSATQPKDIQKAPIKTPTKKLDEPSQRAEHVVEEGDYHDRKNTPIVPTYTFDDYAPTVDEIVALMKGS